MKTYFLIFAALLSLSLNIQGMEEERIENKQHEKIEQYGFEIGGKSYSASLSHRQNLETEKKAPILNFQFIQFVLNPILDDKKKYSEKDFEELDPLAQKIILSLENGKPQLYELWLETEQPVINHFLVQPIHIGSKKDFVSQKQINRFTDMVKEFRAKEKYHHLISKKQCHPLKKDENINKLNFEDGDGNSSESLIFSQLKLHPIIAIAASAVVIFGAAYLFKKYFSPRA